MSTTMNKSCKKWWKKDPTKEPRYLSKIPIEFNNLCSRSTGILEWKAGKITKWVSSWKREIETWRVALWVCNASEQG